MPADSLLQRYVEVGAYTDCYVAEIPGTVSHSEFVEAFYTTTVFKLERAALRALASRPSTDAQARQLARGECGSFAAWTVEGRTLNQLLLSDYTGRTKSWLMVAAALDVSPIHTRLYFGSAVVPTRTSKTGKATFGVVFKALLAFHKLYSKVLLQAARSRVSR